MKSISLLALVGLASVASAGVGDGDLVVTLDFADDVITLGETTTATLTANLSGWGAAAYFSSITADLVASGNFVTISDLAGLNWANPALGAVSPGTPDGSSINNVFGAQLTLFPPVDTTNPLTLITFTVTGIASGVLTYTAVADADVSAPGAFSVTDPTDNPFAAPVYFDLAGQPGTVLVSESLGVAIPAPSALALLGLGGLVAGRRRR